MIDAFRRLVVATGVPSSVFRALAIDPLATEASAAEIVRSTVGGRAWREALAAPTLPARARILLPIVAHQHAADALDLEDHRGF